jgi:hypothetical protein
MCRASVALLAGIVVISAAGHSMAGGRRYYSSCPTYQSSPPRASLLFSPSRSNYVASDFAYRSGWPSTNSYYQGGQIIYFNEHFYDYQGPVPNQDWTYRQFDTYRSGFGYR